MFLAQIALASPQCLEKNEHFHKIRTFLDKFLAQANLRRITQYERDFLWATLLPYIKLIYLPNTPCCEPVLLAEIQGMALLTIIIAMQSMLDNVVHREVLVREGLVDFLTCMPWYTTGPAQERATALVRMVWQSLDMDLQPPSLLNMAKACVAKHYCGLPTVVQHSVPHILQHIASD